MCVKEGAALRALHRHLVVATKPATVAVLAGTLADLIRSKPELVAGNAFPRQQRSILRRILRESVTYFNGARPYQGVQQRLPDGPEAPVFQPESGEKIQAIPVLGGLQQPYQRAAWRMANGVRMRQPARIRQEFASKRRERRTPRLAHASQTGRLCKASIEQSSGDNALRKSPLAFGLLPEPEEAAGVDHQPYAAGGVAELVAATSRSLRLVLSSRCEGR